MDSYFMALDAVHHSIEDGSIDEFILLKGRKMNNSGDLAIGFFCAAVAAFAILEILYRMGV